MRMRSGGGFGGGLGGLAPGADPLCGVLPIGTPNGRSAARGALSVSLIRPTRDSSKRMAVLRPPVSANALNRSWCMLRDGFYYEEDAHMPSRDKKLRYGSSIGETAPILHPYRYGTVLLTVRSHTTCHTP